MCTFMCDVCDACVCVNIHVLIMCVPVMSAQGLVMPASTLPRAFHGTSLNDHSVETAPGPGEPCPLEHLFWRCF